MHEKVILMIPLILSFGTFNPAAESNKTNSIPVCETIKSYEGCACQMSDSKEILGLKFLVTNDTLKRKPRFVATDDRKWFYAFHPCGSFDMFLGASGIGEFACVDDATARFTNESTRQCSGLGKVESGEFSRMQPSVDVISNVTLTFRNMSAVNHGGMTISLICNMSIKAEDSIFRYINKTLGVEDTYYFSLESECCCPGQCDNEISVPKDEKKDYTVWYIVGAVIVVLIIIIIAFIISYSKFRPRPSGPQTAPLLT